MKIFAGFYETNLFLMDHMTKLTEYPYQVSMYYSHFFQIYETKNDLNLAQNVDLFYVSRRCV